jgi:hypothetical protein
MVHWFGVSIVENVMIDALTSGFHARVYLRPAIGKGQQKIHIEQNIH